MCAMKKAVLTSMPEPCPGFTRAPYRSPIEAGFAVDHISHEHMEIPQRTVLLGEAAMDQHRMGIHSDSNWSLVSKCSPVMPGFIINYNESLTSLLI